MPIIKLMEQGRVSRATFGLKSRVNLGNYESAEIVLEFVVDEPTPAELEACKRDVISMMIKEEEDLLKRKKK